MIFSQRIWRGVPALPGMMLVAAAHGGPCEHDLAAGREQVERLQAHVEQVVDEVGALKTSLEVAEGRNRRQAAQIGWLESELRELRAASPRDRRRLRRQFFNDVRSRLPVYPVYQVGVENVVIKTDPIFVFGTGEIGAEGQDRLRALAEVLVDVARSMPENPAWRLRVAGHTDKRALRSSHKFPDNWALSAARALAVVRLLEQSGMPSERLQLTGMGATALLDDGDNKVAHRRNRRIEIALVFQPD